MGFFSKFESKIEDAFENTADKMFDSAITPIQIVRKAEKQMQRSKMLAAGKEYAPTLYTVLVNTEDDKRLFGFYPTLSGEVETRLKATAAANGFIMEGQPLVRFIVDEELKRGKFDVVAEVVSAPIVSQLRNEELVRYGMNPLPQEVVTPQPQPQAPSYANQPLPYVPEEEIDRSLNYGEYTFDSLAFGGDANAPAPMPAPAPTSAPLPAKSGTVQPQNAGIRNTSAPLISNPLYSSESKPSIPLVNNPEQAPAMSADYQQSGQTFGGPLANVPSMPLSQQSGVIDVAKATSRPLNLPNPGEPPRDHVEFPGLGSIPLPDENMQAALEALPSAQTHQGNATVGTYAPSNSLPGQGYIYARLINAATNQTYNITTNRALVGRDTSNDIVVNDLNTSRHHAEIRYEAQNTWVITDLGSTNGTYVNGHPAMRHGLQEGDRITLGLTDFIFTLR